MAESVGNQRGAASHSQALISSAYVLLSFNSLTAAYACLLGSAELIAESPFHLRPKLAAH